VLQSQSTDFLTLFLPRIFLGVFQAGTGPPAYSILADYFPPEKRTFAYSIFSLGIYIGQSISSLTTLIVTALGWKLTFVSIGSMCMVISIISFFVVKEPPRARFDAPHRENKDIQAIDQLKEEKSFGSLVK